MQDSVLQIQQDAQSAFQDNIQPGRVGELLLFFEGTNNSGETGDFDDLGNVVIKRNGETIVNRPVRVFADMLNIRRGSNLNNSATGGAFEATAIIPFYEKSFPQALQITGENELNFSWQPSSAQSTVFANLTLSVYSQLSLLDEEYQYFILGNDVTPAAAVTSRPYQLNTENVSAVYLTDPDSVLTSVAFRQDGAEVYSDQPDSVIEAKTLANNQLETSTIDMLQLKSFTDGQPYSVVNSKNVLQLTTSGSGTIETTICSMRIPEQG